MKSVYIAGPMRGIFEFNFPAFFEAEEKLKPHFEKVWNPARLDAEGGLDWKDKTGNEDLQSLGFDVQEALVLDLEIVSKCDCIYMLSGWERSSGARTEHLLASTLSKTILYQDNLEGFLRSK